MGNFREAMKYALEICYGSEVTKNGIIWNTKSK
jgi:hypothetical protein